MRNFKINDTTRDSIIIPIEEKPEEEKMEEA